VQVVDPRQLRINRLPPPVWIGQVAADGRLYRQNLTGPAVRSLDLPPRIRDLRIEYTALSLVAPEKVRFKYKLEGQDRDWREVVGVRQAQYTNLPPGSYRFRVIACNNSGVWNETGASLVFSIAPAYYQTIAFRALAAAALAALLWAAYRVRVRSVERHSAEISAFNEQLMKAQELERTRIAGELHDSVMQQISALSLVLGTAKRRMPADSEARDMVVDVQRKLIDVGTEVRQLSHDLYPPMLKQAGLAEVLRGYCDAFSHSRGIAASCDVDDSAAELSPGTALALYRIAQEALGNAAKHAAPTRVDVRLLRTGGDAVLTVADDGHGYEPGRAADGGLGLVNMRERARQLGGTFELDSRPGRGTTVRVAVPFRIREANPPEQPEAQK
jgi:signal transduction histidine kinase